MTRTTQRMVATDAEIWDAVSTNTPTASAVPAPDVLAAMKWASRREHLAVFIRRIGRGYLFAGATAGLVSLALLLGGR